MHLSGAGLVDGEAQLHEESLLGLEHRMHHVIHLVAAADRHHVAKHLPTHPHDVLKVLAPLVTTL